MTGSAGKTDEATMSEWERRIGDYGTLALRLRTAEMLGLPARVCGVRNCRRKRSCLLVFTHNRLPLCYTMLSDEERKAHDALFDYAARVYEAAQSGHFGNLYRLLIEKPPEYHQAVTEIVRHALPSCHRAHGGLDAIDRIRAGQRPAAWSLKTRWRR